MVLARFEKNRKELQASMVELSSTGCEKGEYYARRTAFDYGASCQMGQQVSNNYLEFMVLY